MAINSTTVTSKNVRIKTPNGSYIPMAAVVYTAANGQATYTLEKVWSFNDNGTYEIWTDDPVLDSAGNSSVSGKLGQFVVNIPAPPVGDQNPPTMTLVSVTPTSITAAGAQTITVVVSISDS